MKNPKSKSARNLHVNVQLFLTEKQQDLLDYYSNELETEGTTLIEEAIADFLELVLPARLHGRQRKARLATA